jgi:hypothetical protein
MVTLRPQAVTAFGVAVRELSAFGSLKRTATPKARTRNDALGDHQKILQMRAAEAFDDRVIEICESA